MVSKGEARKQAIVLAATRLLTRDGAHGFRLRAVAAEAGVGISHVQYYFASIEDLIEAIVVHYLAVWQERLADVQDDLHAVIDRILVSQDIDGECQLLWELWAMSGHDAKANATLTKYYDQYIGEIARLLDRQFPDRRPAANRQSAELIVALVEGTSILRGSGREKILLPDAVKRLHRAVDLLIKDCESDAA